MRTALLVALLVAPLAAAPAAPADARPVVSGVELRVPPGEDAAAIEGLVAVKPGEPLSPRALRRTVQLLYQLGRFSNIVVRTQPEAGAAPAGAPRVRVVIECLPKRLVRSVAIRIAGGAPPALPDEALRTAARLAPGDELYDERLTAAADAVRAAYLRRGWRAAEVTARADGDPEADVVVEVRQGEPTRVASVSLGRDPGLPAEQLAAGLRTRPGAILDLDVLDADVEALRAALRKAGFFRARVSAPVVSEVGRLARVLVPIQPGPRIEFRFVGNVAFTSEELRGRTGYDAEMPLDAPAIDAAASHLRAFLQARGFADARVSTEERTVPGRALVVFHVEEGRRYHLGAVRFTGIASRPAAWLRARLDEFLEADVTPEPVPARVEYDALAAAGGTAVAWPSRSALPYDPREIYDEATWSRAVEGVVSLVKADGYLDAAPESTRVVLDARRGVVDVEIRMREGVRTYVESISFEGNRELAVQALARESQLGPGDPLSIPAVERTRIALLDLYARNGFLYARIEDAEEFSADRKSAQVRYRVDEGPRVHVANVIVAGAKRTREDVIRSTLRFRSGDVYDPLVASRSQSALLRLGVFRSVGLRLNDPEVPEASKDVTVDLAERPWRTVTTGLGFSIADGPRALVEYSQPNLLGRALELVGRGKVNYPLNWYRPDLEGKTFTERIEGRAELGLHYPRFDFLPFTMGGRVDAIAERLHRRAYDLTRGAAIVGFDFTPASRMSLSLQYEFEVDHITKSTNIVTYALTPADIERLRFPEGVTTLGTVRPVFTVDFRDNSVHPRSGWFASASLDLVHSIGLPGDSFLFGLVPGSEVYTNMLKAAGRISGYVPVGARSVFAVSLRAGQIFPLDPASQTIAPKRFFLGGAATMRGYGEEEMVPEDLRSVYVSQRKACAGSVTGLPCTDLGRQLVAGQTLVSEGGQSFLLLKAEMRVPLAGSLEAGVFADVGNLWFDPNGIDPTGSQFQALRVNTGFGLRVGTPIGPAALDLGFNVSPDPMLNERTAALHFSIGYF